MLKDIVSIEGADLGVQQSEAPRAANVLSTQIGDLEYAPTFGIDIRLFLESEFVIQNESFKAYLVQRLLEHQVNVIDVVTTIERVYHDLTFNIGNSSASGGGFVS
jgi:hypothetical protein